VENSPNFQNHIDNYIKKIDQLGFFNSDTGFLIPYNPKEHWATIYARRYNERILIDYMDFDNSSSQEVEMARKDINIRKLEGLRKLIERQFRAKQPPEETKVKAEIKIINYHSQDDRLPYSVLTVENILSIALSKPALFCPNILTDQINSLREQHHSLLLKRNDDLDFTSNRIRLINVLGKYTKTEPVKGFCNEELKERLLSLLPSLNIGELSKPEELYRLALENIKKNPNDAKKFIFQSAIQHYPAALNELKVAYLAMPELFGFEKIDTYLAKLLCEELASFDNEFQERARYDMCAAFLFGTYGEFKDKDESIGLIQDLEKYEGNCFATEFLDNIDDMVSGDLEEFIDS
jgi:hypothetical protein